MKVVWFLIVINYSVLGKEQNILENGIENTETNSTPEGYVSSFSTITNSSPVPISSTTDVSTTSTTEFSCPEDLQVAHLMIDASSFNATLTWDPPEYVEECAEMYVIYHNNLSIENLNITETTWTIPNLSACEFNTVKIEVKLREKYGTPVEANFTTTAPDPFEYGVKDLSFIRSGDSLRVSWKPPPVEVMKCVKRYRYNLTEGGTSTSNDTPETSIPPVRLIGCRYEITVIPIIDDIEGLPQTANFTLPLVTNQPQLVGNTTSKTSINVTWQTDDKEMNECPLVQIVVICNATEDLNGDFGWIIKNGQSEINISSTDQIDDFSMEVQNLSPFTNYTCEGYVENSAGNSNSTHFTISTQEDVPSAPKIIDVNATSTNFVITWAEPDKIPGIFLSYNLTIRNDGPNYQQNCPDPDNKNHPFPNIHETEFNFSEALPYHNYTITISGATRAGSGEEANEQIITKPSEPESVRNATFSNITYSQNDTYSAKTTLHFDPPCYTNGPFKSYQINMTGDGKGQNGDQIIIEINQTSTELDLKPDLNYTGNIWVTTEGFRSSPLQLQIRSNPGVPTFMDSVLKPPTSNDTAKAYFELKKSAFDETNGEILYYALFVFPQSEKIGTEYGFWDSENWPNCSEAYQVTPKFWNPFEPGVDTIDFIIGTDETCSENYCNKALTEDTNYTLIVRALTRATFRNSLPLHFKKGMQTLLLDVLDQLDLGLILGLIFGLLAVLIITASLVYLWRRRGKTIIDEEGKPFSASTPPPIPCKKFLDYYNTIKDNNYNVLKTQYAALGNLGKEIAAATPTTFALLPENKRKNRYTNILPYDATRVTLNIDEDDEISSDYIKSSYIKGFSAKTEYIATQGPLESTSKHFWKMIVQENVTIIMMVSQFVEQNKDKCFHYFPNNHETLNFGESLEVRCSTELHFGTYCIRTLQVRKDSEQRNVIHMQFLEWPVFGVPQSTDSMLQFCHQMREKANAEGGLIAVHCSAGVGRTGTLIALDILLQTIDNHRDIDIFKIVLDLRKQRINMVQTEKQYTFLHSCVKEYLEAPIINSNDPEQNPVYENMDVLRSSLKKTLIETNVESEKCTYLTRKFPN